MAIIRVDDLVKSGSQDMGVRQAALCLRPGDELVFGECKTYFVGFNILLPSGVRVWGNGSWIDFYNSGSAVALADKAKKYSQQIEIQGLNLKTKTGSVGFDFHGLRHSKISQCVAVGFAEAGFKLDGGGQFTEAGNPYYYGAWWNTIELCAAWYCKRGLVLTGQNQSGQANANTISRCSFLKNAGQNNPGWESWGEFADTIGVEIVEGNGNLLSGVDVSRNDTGVYIDDADTLILGCYLEYNTTGIMAGPNAARVKEIGSRFVLTGLPVGGNAAAVVQL